MGDHFAWAADTLAGEKERNAAREAGLDIHAYLTQQAAELRPGQSGLLALDWWNGNRSVLTDVHLSGLLLGMTLQTTCAEIYRALIEATAYGARMIVDAYRDSGISVTQMCAAGGIAIKNDLAMRIFCDVLDMPIHVAGTSEASALGSAVFASVAAGVHPSVKAATRAMGQPGAKTYTPIPRNAAIYQRLYQEYARLHDTFGRGGNDVMKRLLRLKGEQPAANQP
jgi:L-ribulokinase